MRTGAPQKAHIDGTSARRRSRWDRAARWRALESVADQLGDPPRYRRYAELYAQPSDLPSPATVRLRLGLWSGIAAALIEYRQRNGISAGTEPELIASRSTRRRAGRTRELVA